jgi:ABC-2 type transport system permease protein
VCLIAVGVVLAAFLRSTQTLNAVNGLTVMTMAGLGGAFTPIDILPGWAQAVAPATPTYWAMQGYRAVVLQGGGLMATLEPTLILLAFTVVLVLVGLRRFSFEETKLYVG